MTASPAPEGASFTFDLRLYRLSSIKKAVYRFTADYLVTITQPSEREVCVTLCAKNPEKAPRIDASCLTNEVIDQDLREIVAEETQQVRSILLAQAFSGLAITEVTGEEANYRDDPMGINNSSHTA